MSFAIFLIEYDLGDTRNHHAIFVRSDGQAGYIFHVKGNIHDGMIYEMKKIRPPHTYRTFVGKHQIGWVSSFNMGRLDSICRSNPPPEKQYHGNRRLNPRRPLRRCQEWTAETIGRLEEQGVLIGMPGQASVDASISITNRYSFRRGPQGRQAPSNYHLAWSSEIGGWYHIDRHGQTVWLTIEL